jgi:hypothetical protein
LRSIRETWHDTGVWSRQAAAAFPEKARLGPNLLLPGAAEKLTSKAQVKVQKDKSLKQLVLEVVQTRGLECVREAEIRAIQAELRRRLGNADHVSASYIANLARQAGKRVEYNHRFVDPLLEEPYASRLRGVLRFHDLESAETSLRKLDEIYREYREISDRVGTTCVRSLALKGKQRAESLGASPRVSPRKRQEKQEIARWFKVWLDVSDLFFDWLEMRKESAEFKSLFANGDPNRKLPSFTR